MSLLVHNKCPIIYCGADSSNLEGEKERKKTGGIKDKASRMRGKKTVCNRVFHVKTGHHGCKRNVNVLCHFL